MTAWVTSTISGSPFHSSECEDMVHGAYLVQPATDFTYDSLHSCEMIRGGEFILLGCVEPHPHIRGCRNCREIRRPG